MFIAYSLNNFTEISNAYSAEDCINNLRNHLREAEIEEIENGSKKYQTGFIINNVVFLYK